MTEALLDPETVIDEATKTVVVRGDFNVPLHRQDGSVRDIDLIVFTNRPELISQLRSRLLAQLPNTNAPEISLSGYECVSLRRAGYVEVVSQFIKQDDGSLTIKLGPVVQRVSVGDQEDVWRLQYGGMTWSILHPIVHLRSYEVRSITGVRPKDSEKVKALEAKLLRTFLPEAWERFQGWQEFAMGVASAITLRNAFAERGLRLGCLALTKYVLSKLERSSILVRLTNQSGPVHWIASRFLRASRPSLRE